MRAVAIGVAALVSVLALVKGRRAASLAKQNVRRSNRVHAVENAARQKPGQAIVPKLPKVKRY